MNRRRFFLDRCGRFAVALSISSNAAANCPRTAWSGSSTFR
jgi:hypothetical protein